MEFVLGGKWQTGVTHAINTYLSVPVNSLLLISPLHQHTDAIFKPNTIKIDCISENRGHVGAPGHRQSVFKSNMDILPKKKRNKLKINRTFQLKVPGAWQGVAT